MVDRITFAPDPPEHGKQLTICYDFPGSGSVRLKVTFAPPGSSTIHTVTSESPCVTITVPDDATSIVVDDLDGGSASKESPVA